MIERRITVADRAWKVTIAGRFTVYDRDEVPLVFEPVTDGGQREQRVTRFSPAGSKSRSQALAELTDAELAVLLEQSQPEWTSPELGYVRR
jgi:hypothetical protein